MDEDVVLERGDIIQQYLNCVVKYKDRIVYVEDVDLYSKVSIVYLETMKRDTVPFNLSSFKVAKNRIGMINFNGFVFYADRVPVRKMQIGLCTNNLQISRPQFNTLRDYNSSWKMVSGLKETAVFSSMVNKFPTFSKCLEVLREGNKSVDCMAWDRQFAVDKEGFIYYKISRVGNIPVGKNKESDIVFNAGYEYLSIVLEGNYEKTITITCS